MQPTIVGLPLELLPDLPSVIAEVPLAERKSLIFPPVTDDPYKPSKENGPPKSSKPPREVWRLLERLITDGAGVDKLWTSDEATGAMLEVIDVSCDSSLADSRLWILGQRRLQGTQRPRLRHFCISSTHYPPLLYPTHSSPNVLAPVSVMPHSALSKRSPVSMQM